MGGKSRAVNGSAAQGSREVRERGVSGDGWDSRQYGPSLAGVPLRVVREYEAHALWRSTQLRKGDH